jgi:hypothetical protein
MRRPILAVSLGAVLLMSAACDSDAEPVASAPSVAAPTPTPTPTVTTPDYSADTRKVCAGVQKIFDNDIEPFAAALSRMVVRKEAKLTKEAAASEQLARKQLRTVASKLVKATAGAEDPEVVTAGRASAAKFTASAGDDKLYDRLKSTKDLDRFIDGKMGDWLTPISGYCA